MKLQDFVSQHRWTSFILATGAVIVIIAVWLHFPLTQNPGSSNGYECSRLHIYIPRRLDFKGCRTVTGTIKQIKIEQDGDSHALLMLDEKYNDMLTPQNYQQQQGYLVIEDTCHARPKELLAHFVCYNFVSSLPNPEVDKRYEITGNYVIDDWHGSWAEIHGLSELKPLD